MLRFSSMPSTSGQRASKSLSRWSPRCNKFWIRCCVSRPSQRGLKRSDGGEQPVGGRQRDMVDEILRPRRWHAGRRGDPARESVDEPSISASGRARLTYPYRSAESPSKSFALRTISCARPRPTWTGDLGRYDDILVLPALGERIGDLASNSEAFRLTRNGFFPSREAKALCSRHIRPCWDGGFRHGSA